MRTIILCGLLLLGAWLRLDDATANVRFHSDEALYSTYARNAAVHGQWMLDGPVDKPPLSLYANALSMHLFAARITPQNVIDVPIRAGEFTARMPNVIAGMLAIAFVYQLALRLYHDERTALLTAGIMAVSPFAVAYSASAFTDMLMLVLMLGALVSAVAPRPTWTHALLAGLLLALSVAAKPQGIFYLPLLVVLPRPHLRRLPGIVVGFTLGFGLLMAWDATRPETSFWALGATNISQGRLLAPVTDWGERLTTWLTHADGLLGVPLWSLAGVGLPAFALWWPQRQVNFWLWLWIVGFCGVHWLGAFYTFDRYLLPLVPLLALLAADTLRRWTPQKALIPMLLLIAVLGVSGDHDPRADVFRPTQPDAYITFTQWINDKPLGTIIYNPWLGWEIGYYIGAWSDKRMVYYPDAQTLADDALQNPDAAPRYLLVPASRDPGAWLDALQANGFLITSAYNADGLQAYEVIPPWAVPQAAY